MSAPTKPSETFEELARKLVANHEHCQPVESACSSGNPIPQYRKLVELIKTLRNILFPRFAERSAQLDSGIDHFCLNQLKKAQLDLCELVCQAYITYGEKPADDPNWIAQSYLQGLPEIRSRILTDIEAAYDGDPACRSTDEVILCYPGLTAVTIYRLANALFKMKIPLLPRMMTEWAHGETGIDIHPGATIGDFFFIDHGTGVVIGETCEIGDHVKIYQGVTLGALSFQKDSTGQLVRDTKRHPTIENNVVIYANATVLGGKTVVGHHSVVGSSVWLTRSVDPYTTVMMERPKLRIRNEMSTSLEPLDYQI